MWKRICRKLSSWGGYQPIPLPVRPKLKGLIKQHPDVLNRRLRELEAEVEDYKACSEMNFAWGCWWEKDFGALYKAYFAGELGKSMSEITDNAPDTREGTEIDAGAHAKRIIREHRALRLIIEKLSSELGDSLRAGEITAEDDIEEFVAGLLIEHSIDLQPMYSGESE